MKVMHRLAMASRQHERINIPSVYSYPCQLHPKYGMGRFVWDIDGNGTVAGLGSSTINGMSVWDYDTQNNKWRLSVVANKPTDGGVNDWPWWSWTRSGVYALVSDGQIIGVDGSYGGLDSQTKECWRAIVDVAVKPRFSVEYGGIEYAGEENINNPSFYSRPCVGFDGKLIFGYYTGYFSGDPETSNSGWINTITDSSFSAMSGALRTDLIIGQYSGQPGLGISWLGGVNPNGYIVANAPGNDVDTTSTFALVNCNSTPYVVSRVSWTGYQRSVNGVLAISADRVVVADRVDSSYNGRLNLLYANSATSPTALTRGASATVPSLPSGLGYSTEDVDHASFSSIAASNYWAKDGALLVLVYYKMNDETYIYSPVIVRSSGNSNLTVEHATTDVFGHAAKKYNGGDYGNFQLCVVGAPDDKATVLAVDNNGNFTQQTFQL
jgi:hypothetical protein